MSKKDAYNATKQSMVLYGGLFKEVVKEVGLEKALAMREEQGKQFGAVVAGMLKEELGKKKLNFVALESVRTKLVQTWGMTPKAEKKRGLLKMTYPHCPLYDGCISAGLDQNTIEMMCHQMSALEFDEIKKVFPQFTGCVKVKSKIDEPCIEEFSLK